LWYPFKKGVRSVLDLPSQEIILFVSNLQKIELTKAHNSPVQQCLAENSVDSFPHLTIISSAWTSDSSSPTAQLPSFSYRAIYLGTAGKDELDVPLTPNLQ